MIITINNKELIPLFYLGLKGEDLNKDIFYDGKTFSSVDVKIKVLKIENSVENFFDDFIILEEMISRGYDSKPGFSCIVKFDSIIYVYQINYDRTFEIYRVPKDAVPGGVVYLEIGPYDKNYHLLSSKIDILMNLIFKKSKYKISELLSRKDKDIDYINF